MVLSYVHVKYLNICTRRVPLMLSLILYQPNFLRVIMYGIITGKLLVVVQVINEGMSNMEMFFFKHKC